MTEEKQNIAIYKLLGYQPVKSWKFYHDKEKTRASLGFRTKRDALEWMEGEKNSWPYTQYPQEYEYSEPEEYEDWFHCPQVDLALLHKAEESLTNEEWLKWEKEAACLGRGRRGSIPLTVFIARMTVKQHREVLLKTLNLWEE